MVRAPRRALLLASVLALAMTLPATVSANHSWGGYHWARTSNPFTVKLGDNVSSAWDSYLATASNDWSKSTVLDTNVVPGSANPKNCKATTGMVQVCDSTYGFNGWLGVAGISITGGTHITKAYVKLNDSYFNSSTYNTPAWRQMVTCQEVGHTFGLDHQDENFNNTNLGTCMDYTNDPTGKAGTNGTLANTSPNQHDYDELAIIYSHLDASTTLAAGAPGAAAAAPNGRSADAAWGTLVRASADGRAAWYVRDFGNGDLELTHVLFAF